MDRKTGLATENRRSGLANFLASILLAVGETVSVMISRYVRGVNDEKETSYDQLNQAKNGPISMTEK